MILSFRHAAPAERALPLLGRLCRAVARPESESEPEPIVQAAMAHLWLAAIHPFRDGNGRTARLLQSLILARAGLLEPAVCSVESWLWTHRSEYYAALSETCGPGCDPKRSAKPFLDLTLRAHVEQIETEERRADRTERIYTAVEAEVVRLALPERVTMALVNLVLDPTTPLDNAMLRASSGTSALTASRDLERLVAVGLIEAHGERRGRKYGASASLTALAS